MTTNENTTTREIPLTLREYMKAGTAHAACDHPMTKSGRAKCRAKKAKAAAILAADNAAWEAEMAPIRAREAAEKIWNEEFPKFCSAHQGSAHQNADDTASEEGFEMYSERWYQVAVSTLHHARDTADAVMNPMDPEPGQSLMIAGGTDYLWVEHVKWGEGVAAEVTVIDREGNHSVIKPGQIETY